MRTANKLVHVADVDVDGVVQWAVPCPVSEDVRKAIDGLVADLE